jgi:hypothetical protein
MNQWRSYINEYGAEFIDENRYRNLPKIKNLQHNSEDSDLTKQLDINVLKPLIIEYLNPNMVIEFEEMDDIKDAQFDSTVFSQFIKWLPKNYPINEDLKRELNRNLRHYRSAIKKS